MQKVCAHVTGLPKAAEVAESPLDKMFGGVSDKGKSLVALKEEALERRRMLQRAAHEAGGWVSGLGLIRRAILQILQLIAFFIDMFLYLLIGCLKNRSTDLLVEVFHYSIIYRLEFIFWLID